MVFQKFVEMKGQDVVFFLSIWVKWKCGGIIGVVVLIGGILMVIIGGMVNLI